jgi:DNA-binding NtrC family response regulator
MSDESYPLLVATSDPKVRGELLRVIQECHVKARFASSVRGVQAVLSREPVSLVVCGSALDDGTYRDVLHGLRRRGNHVPLVVASDPDTRAEFDHFLKALHHGAFDFLCFPYRWYELRSILEQAQREQALDPARMGAAHVLQFGDPREPCHLA